MKSFDLIKPFFFEKRFVILSGVVCLVLVDFLQLFIPRIIKWAVDDLSAFRIDLKRLTLYFLWIVILGILIGLFRFIWRQCLIGTSRRVEEGLRNRLFLHLQTLSAAYFDRVKTGELMAHATNDIQHIRMATGMGMVALTDAVVLGTASIGFMAYINLRLTLFVLIPMPLIIFGTRFFSKKMHRSYQAVQTRFADLTEIARESFAGIRILKAYLRQPSAAERMDRASKDYIASNLKLVRITGSFFPMMILFSNISLAIVLYLGGRQTISATITPGDFVAFISYLGLLTWPMMAMGWVTNLIQRGKASLDRIDRIMQTRPDIGDAPAARPLTSIAAVTFEQVSFSYPPASPPVVADICFTLRAGRILGLVGPPGCGKTTLINLIPRLYECTAGRIRIDGRDLREFQTASLRSKIATMPQEPFLFADTVRNNITFGDPRITETELAAAIRAAALSETIASFPDGLDTLVGEKGIILSGGQKQRITLARALVKPAPVLILDDPISQVDTRTGARIMAHIRSMAGQRTVIIVSHRLSAVCFADMILCMREGRIAARGRHADLMRTSGYYAENFRLQEIEEALDAS